MTTSPGLAAAWPEDLAAAGARAAIVVVCREPGPLEILSRELSKRYGADYQIVVCDPPADLETRTRDLLAAALPVAMIIGKIGAQDRDGIEVLAAIRAIPRRSGSPQFAGVTGNPCGPSSTPSPWARSTTRPVLDVLRPCRVGG